MPTWPAILFLLFLIALTCPLCAGADTGTATFQQYDPNRTGEMIEQGLLEPMDPDQYAREMAALNESENMTLGCDDFPRCDPTVVPAPHSVFVVLAALGMVVVLSWNRGKR
jgi:hypothetical protein